MALIKCPECEKEISDKAVECPNCGYPLAKKKKVCDECGKEIFDGISKCPNCGNPLIEEKKKEKVKTKTTTNKKINIKVIIGCAVFLVLLFVVVIILINKNNNKLVCTRKLSNDAAVIDNKVTFTFSDGKIESVSANLYTKPSDSDVAEYLWSVTNKNQDQYNYYDGVSFKATFSEQDEINIIYEIDAKKAPNMFAVMSTLDGVSGISISSTKEEVKRIYEENDYKCN